LIWNAWLENNKNKWWYPSVDHIIPTSRGGQGTLENIQFLTWFENRAKADMTGEEWNIFKKETGTNSQLFIEMIEYHHRAAASDGRVQGDTVLDNCMGSGTTGIACINLGRNFIGMEKDDIHFENAKKRIEDHQKKKEADEFFEFSK